MKVLLVAEEAQYVAEVKGDILTVSTWGPLWAKPGREVGVVDLVNFTLVKQPEDLCNMEVLIEAIKAVDPMCGLKGYEVFYGEPQR